MRHISRTQRFFIAIAVVVLMLTACSTNIADNDDAVRMSQSTVLDSELPADAVSDASSSEISSSEASSGDASSRGGESSDESSDSSSEQPDNAKRHIVAIDAGHQKKGNLNLEPIGPGASEKKARVTYGTVGVSTGVSEYQLNLDIAMQLKEELSTRDYEVVMIRETNDVDISNRERAQVATEAGADVFVRIHADASDNAATEGIMTMSPTRNNPYVSKLYEDSRRLSQDILDQMIQQTGAYDRGVREVDTMSGINWSTMPVTLIEMGLMTNPEEDERMQTPAYQKKLVKGIADGIDAYFATETE